MKDFQALANQLTNRYEVEAVTVEFGYSNADFTLPRNYRGPCFGQADSYNRVVRLLVRGEAEMEETLRHELAHVIAGNWHKHDKVWKSTARKLGAHPYARVYNNQGQNEQRKATKNAKKAARAARRKRERELGLRE